MAGVQDRVALVTGAAQGIGAEVARRLEAGDALARPEAAVHVGDSLLTDVGGARKAGIRPIHFDPFQLCALTDHEHADSMAAVVRLVRGSRA